MKKKSFFRSSLSLNMFSGAIRKKLHFPSNFRSLTTMQSATTLNSRRYNRRPVKKRSQIAGLDQGSVTDAGRQMMMASSMATAVAPSPQHIMAEPKHSAPAHKEGRHFTNQRFADAPISPASRGAIQHE